MDPSLHAWVRIDFGLLMGKNDTHKKEKTSLRNVQYCFEVLGVLT
jgi:hypothetical protein